MEQDKQSMTNPEQEPNFSIVPVPEELRERVVNFVRQLQEEEADTSGFMMRSGLGWTGTNCQYVKTGGPLVLDTSCSDQLHL